jgi:hypothetical protein
MYFVTTNRQGYILFSMTPSERAAIGLTDKQVVRLLLRASGGAEWTVLREWNAKEFSPTDFMAALHDAEEPADPHRLLDVLPPRLRGD